MGFELVEEREDFCFVFDRAAGLAIVFSGRNGTVAGRFDELNVGLDHLELAIPDVETLLSWEQWLAQLAV